MSVPAPVLPISKVEVTMRISGFRKARRKRTEPHNHSEAAVATIWLVFYVLGIAVAASSPFISRAIELAAH